jgi:hypothetical protein
VTAEKILSKLLRSGYLDQMARESEFDDRSKSAQFIDIAVSFLSGMALRRSALDRKPALRLVIGVFFFVGALGAVDWVWQKTIVAEVRPIATSSADLAQNDRKLDGNSLVRSNSSSRAVSAASPTAEVTHVPKITSESVLPLDQSYTQKTETVQANVAAEPFISAQSTRPNNPASNSMVSNMQHEIKNVGDPSEQTTRIEIAADSIRRHNALD